MTSALTVRVLSEPTPERVLLYSDDETGGRRLRRCVAVAERMVTRSPRLQVVLVTGAIPRTRPRLPRGVSILRLPLVPARPGAAADLAAGVVRRARAAILSDVASRIQPDLVVVDRASRRAERDLTSAVDMLRRRAAGAGHGWPRGWLRRRSRSRRGAQA